MLYIHQSIYFHQPTTILITSPSPDEYTIPAKITISGIMQFISLGCSCLPKFGIENYLEKQATLFYDWVITDMCALRTSLLKFDESKFFLQGLKICDEGIRVLDLHTGLKFQHEFPATNGSIIEYVDQSDVDRVRETYTRRRARMFDIVQNTETPIFVRYEFSIDAIDIAKDYASTLKNLLSEAFNRPFTLIILAPNIEDSSLSEDVHCVQALLAENISHKADDNTWHKVKRISNYQPN